MPSSTLTSHDLVVLEKIQDPEAGPSPPLLIDSSLPRDPHIAGITVYLAISALERSIIASIQAIELQIAGLKPGESGSPLARYRACVEQLDELIDEHPDYASARNNRAQALRRIYGDGVLVQNSTVAPEPAPLDTLPDNAALTAAATTLLVDLSAAISLLTPRTPFTPLSPQAAKTLSQAYTQRGALYLATSRLLSLTTTLRISTARREAHWSKTDFESNASRDFMLGGRYGNEVARALAVASNPTAKLCGAIVKEAMRKEFGFGDKKEWGGCF